MKNSYKAAQIELISKAQAVSKVLAYATAALAVVALLGWQFNIEGLRQLSSNSVAMNPLSAVIFILSAASVALTHRRTQENKHSTAIVILATTITLISALMLLHYVLGFSLPLDELLYGGKVQAANNHMAPNSAFLFTLIGLAILVARTNIQRLPQLLASAVLVVALFAFEGYLYGSGSLYQLHNLAPMSLPAVICFLMIGTAVFFLRFKDRGINIILAPNAAGFTLRKLQVAALIVPFIVGWLVLTIHKHGTVSTETSIAILVLIIVVVFSYIVWSNAAIIYDLEKQRMAAENKAKRQEAQLYSVMQSLPVGVALVSLPSAQVSLVNPAAITLIGEDPRTKGLSNLSIFRANGAPYPFEELPLVMAIATNEVVVKNDLVVHHTDGTQIPLRITAAPLATDSTKAKSGILIFEDYSKDLEIEKAKDEFLSLATHQLQTPLTGVKGFLALLRDGMAGPLNAEQLDLVHEAYDGNERERHIVADLLNVGRAESGRMVLAKQNTDITAMLSSVIHEQQATIDGRKQTIDLQIAKQPIIAFVDPDRLRMCIENLVSNASKYTDEGGKLIVSLCYKNGITSIAVKDSGVGIAKKDIDHLFKRFSRIDNKLSQKVGGTGLGLYLVRQIIELHGGKVLVESEPGKGTTFTIILPSSAPAPIEVAR